MMLKWINSVVQGDQDGAVREAADEGMPRIRRLEGRDIAHESLMMREREKARVASPAVAPASTEDSDRATFKSVLKKHVFDVVRDNFKFAQGPVLEEVTEEITDQIAQAADADPYYRRGVDDESD